MKPTEVKQGAIVVNRFGSPLKVLEKGERPGVVRAAPMNWTWRKPYFKTRWNELTGDLDFFPFEDEYEFDEEELTG